MSEEMLQRGLIENPEKIGEWDFYNIGATNINALKKYKIIPNRDYGTLGRKKPDGIIVDNKNVIALIENKTPSELSSKKKIDKAIDQELDVAKSINAKVLIVTDTKNKNFWINPITNERITDENGEILNKTFDPNSEETVVLLTNILNSINDRNSQLKKPELKDPSPLAKKIWQDVWSVSGAVPENCLYTFIELFIFKYLSDLNILSGSYNFHNVLDKYKIDSEEDVLEYYANVIRPKIKELFSKSPTDNTTIINGTIFVSKDDKAVKGYSSVFKKILEKFKAEGKLENIHHDFKSKLFESFLKESISKKNWGQFFTPLKVVRAIISMVDIREDMTICDPACGVGKFLLEPILEDIDKFYSIENKKLVSKIKLVGFDKGFDKDEQKTIILAKANMLIYFANLIKKYPSKTKQFSKLFNDTFELKTNSILGSLSDPIENEYDLILTNPPYVTSGSSNLKEEIKKSDLEYHYTQNASGIEGLFVEWIIKSLKPSGTAFIVVPDGFLSRNNDSNLRKFLIDECNINAVISLPPKTFFTTLKKTYILSITKKNKKTIKQKEPVFTYLASSIGETLDVYRIDIDSNDLVEASALYNQFKGAKKHFKSQSKRCQTVPFKWFEENYDKSWLIEDLWSSKKLIALGIKEKDNVIKVDEFSSYLEELNATIGEYQNQLNNLSDSVKKYKEVKIIDTKFFEIISGGLGMKRNEYAVLDTNKDKDIPIYTATLNPVAHFKSGSVKRQPNQASEELPHISFASDGDGTAGTNIVFHTQPYYINTSRLTFKAVDESIYPEYIYFSIQDIKSKYGFDYKHKATLKNIGKIKIKIPIDENGEFDLDMQKEISEKRKMIQLLKADLKERFDQIINSKIDIE